MKIREISVTLQKCSLNIFLMQDYSHLSPTGVPEEASDLYATLRQHSAIAEPKRFYRALGQTLRLAAEQKTAFVQLTLGGLFAKIDYLCKEYNVPWHLRGAINDARGRIMQRSGGATTDFMRHDLRAVCRFVEAVYGVPVPQDLQALFPREEDETPAQRPAGARVELPFYLRVTVTAWDATGISATTEQEESLHIAFKMPSGDWSYLARLLHEGAQLNLVRPRRLTDGTMVAEVVVYEPDYLVDVTSVAGCFEEYSQTPFLHLLHRLQPPQQSSAIVLGNLASQLLDDEVHERTTRIEEFVRDNALTLLALQADGALDYDGLIEQAREQLKHIRYALHQGLERYVGSYDSRRVMLEPSFVSEMLGLQGRMDLLQLDHRVIIEQKSGKGAYNPGQPDTPRQQVKHYVQMLLYMAVLRYNFHEEYAAGGGNLQAFLLYSKYAEPLLGLGAAPQLLFDAFRVRNGLVWYEEYYCQGGVRLLERLTADKLNQQGAKGPLWERYQRPQLEALLQPVHLASALEREYYFRMLEFVAREHYIAKVGNNTSQTNCYASKWFLTLDEKHESGEIYDGLRLVHCGEEHSVEEVQFEFEQELDADTTNFRQGDIVIFYAYPDGAVPDCRRTIVHRGTLVAMGSRRLKVLLRSPQSDARIFERHAHCYWAIEHDSIESSFTGLYSGIHRFLSAPQERRDLLLLQRPPRIEERALKGEYGAFTELARHVKAARDFYLIIGPPGTGKTSYGMLYTLQEQLAEPGSNVLLLSYTNRAVDEICSKLVEEGIDFVRIGNLHNCAPEYHPYSLTPRPPRKGGSLEEAQRTPDAAPSLSGKTGGEARGELETMQHLVDGKRVFVGTTTTMSAQHALFTLKHFDLAIIDEASQILEPHLIGLLSEMTAAPRSGEDDAEGPRPAIAKFVMIGDNKQLPAVVQQSAEQSAVKADCLVDIGLTDCRSSLFERLLRRYGKDPSMAYMLQRQGRMHRDIADFPSRAFYGGLLDVVPLPHQVEEGDGPRVVFIPAETPEESVNDKVNLVEARIIADLVCDIAARDGGESGDGSESIGVIVPYRNQIAAIRSLLPTALRGITIDTVERYQGSQRDHIIYGFTIQKRYQLAFLTSNVFMEDGHPIDRKLNVAMTRARKHLYIVGNPQLLAQNQTFARLMEYVKSEM